MKVIITILALLIFFVAIPYFTMLGANFISYLFSWDSRVTFLEAFYFDVFMSVLWGLGQKDGSDE